MSSSDMISNALFLKLKTRFPGVTFSDKNNLSNKVEDAIFFDFPFEVNGEKLASITIFLGDKGTLKLLRTEDQLEDSDDRVKKLWFTFLRDMRNFAKSRLLNFQPMDPVKGQIQKRDYFKDTPMSESALYGSTRSSYQKLENTKLIIRHSKRIEEESPNSRTRNIDAVFVESENGERFRYPFVHLAGARAMQRHCSNGGSPYDDFGQYIVGLSENIYNLRRFNHLVNRTAFLENTEVSGIAEAAKNKSINLKKTLESIQKQRGYLAVKENFIAFEKKEVDEEMLEDLKNRFTLHQFNEELKDLFPYITDLLGEGGGTASMGMKNPEQPQGNKLGDPRGNNMSTTDMDESGNDIESIINNFQQDVEEFKAGGDMSDELFDALYQYYVSSGEMPYGIQKGREGDPMDWVAQQFEHEIGHMGTQMEESEFGNPEEILRSVAQTLEREVEWPLTEIMDGATVKKLLAPLMNAIHQQLQHHTSEVDEAKPFVKGAPAKGQGKPTGDYDDSDAAQEPVTDYKDRPRDEAWDLKTAIEAASEIRMEPFDKASIVKAIDGTHHQIKELKKAAEQNPKEKKIQYGIEKAEARLGLLQARLGTAEPKATNNVTKNALTIEHLATHVKDDKISLLLSRIADDYPRMDKSEQKEVNDLIRMMMSKVKLVPMFSNESTTFEELESLLNRETITTENSDTKLDYVQEYERRLSAVIGENNDLLSQDPDVQQKALSELNELMKEHFPVGTNGINAKESLRGIIDDSDLDEVFEQISKQDADTCARSAIMDWIKEKAPELESQIDSGDMASDPTNPQAQQQPAAPQPAAPQPADNGQAPVDEEFEDQNNEITEFVKSLYDSTTGNFPRGETGVLVSATKKFGPQCENQVKGCIETLKHSFDENIMRMRKLAGVSH